MMPDVYEIVERIHFLCIWPKATGLDCTAVQLSAQRWHEHWQAFFDAMGRDS